MSRDNRRNRPGYYAPPMRGNSSSHSALGYWVPLVVTGTLALGGLAAWIWSERTEDDEDDYPGPKPQRPPTGQGNPYPTQGSQPYPGPPPPQQAPGGIGSVPPAYPGGPVPGPPGGEAASYYQQDTQSRDVYASGQQQHDEAGWYGRVQGVMRRTPSPQQFFDNASKQVQAGWAAAGAALGSIVEEEKDDDHEDSRRAIRSEERRAERRTAGNAEKEGFSDHERWSEEADERQKTSTVEAESTRRIGAAREQGKGKGRSKRSVAVVVSADSNADITADENVGYRTEHASILSHLPTSHTSTTDSTDLFVLIYSPTLTSLPPLDYQPHGNGIPSTAGSTYSAISTPAETPGSELQSISPRIEAADRAPSKTFDLLYQQALTLVSSPTQILPFTTPSGFVPILRHLAPNLVYVSDTLAGDEGANLAQLKGWVGNAVLVAGDQGTGGLADTETETEDERNGSGGDRDRRKESKWYEHSDLVGLGKGVEVVDAARVGEDWAKRVGGRS